MAAFWGPYCTCGTSWTITETTTATTATQRCCCTRFTVVATNYLPVFDPELPKCEHKSIKQMRRINEMADRRVCPKRRPQRVHGRVCLPILPRQRIQGWPSLKEKRETWRRHGD